MAIAVFDLTEHTQMSIRGTTGTRPDSKYVFGVHIGTDEIHAEQMGLTPDISAYEDMDWSKAAELAKWILDAESKDRFSITEHDLTDNCTAACVWNPVPEDFELYIYISVRGVILSGGIRDICEWERAVRLAGWILEWKGTFNDGE